MHEGEQAVKLMHIMLMNGLQMSAAHKHPYSQALTQSPCCGSLHQTWMTLQMNGTANVNIVEAASAAGVPRMAFISVHDYALPGNPDPLPPDAPVPVLSHSSP